MKEDKTVGEERKVACLECDTETYHKVLKSVSESEDAEWGFYWAQHEIIRCQGCHTVSFRKAWGDDDIVGEDDEGNPVYESSEALFPGRVRGRKQLRYVYELPADVAKIYRETHKAISSEQPVLTGMGIRALVEAVCAEKNTKGNDLKERIDDLVSLGVLTKEGAEILHHTRLYGNKAAHETVAIKESDLGVLMDIAENLLENVYILPKKADKLKPRPIKKIVKGLSNSEDF